MAFFKIDNVKIAGISACVPPKQVENIDSTLIEDKKELEKYIETTGVKRRYIAEEGICSSDLCLEAAEKIIEELDWKKEDIECLIFVSQTPDYIFPATACVLQDRLKLSSNCMSFDITMSCPGWIYGLSTISAILSAGKIKKGLLLVGETSTKAKSPYDRVNLLAGDAGTATALEFNTSASPIIFDMHTDGSNFKSLIIPDGGYRNPVTKESFEYVMCKDDILRNRLQANMEGDSIFSFAVNTAPKEINALLSKLAVDKADVDYFLIHQANQMINKFIQKRLKVDDSKCIYNITDFGNTSSTSIPLMIISKLREKFIGMKIVCSACGTGLAGGNMVLDTCTDGVFPELIRYAGDKTDN